MIVQGEGAYAYKCTSHFGAGMVGFINVGDPSINLEAIEDIRYPGRSKMFAAEHVEEIKTDI